MSNSAPNFARVAVLISIVAAAVLAGTADAAARDPHASLLARIDSLYAKGRAETATALIDSLVTAARATGDRSLDAAMTSRRASVHMYFRRYSDAIRDAEHAIGIARARRDSLTWSRALLAKGRVLMFQERPAAALPVYRELMRVSRNLDRPGLQGNARLGLAFLDLQEGRLVRAERGYRAAVGLLSGGVDIGGELSAKVGLARTLRAQGKPRDAQAIYRDVIRRAIEVGDLRDQADAWNNLGAIEVRSGSRSRATSYFQRALECYRRIGLPTGTPTTNLALLLLEQHRYREARQLLEEELARVKYPQSSESGYRLRTRLAVTLKSLGQAEEGARLLTELWANRDSVSQETAVGAGIALATTLRQPEARLALMDQIMRVYGPGLDPEDRSSLEAMCARAELDRGAEPAALAWARRAMRSAPAATGRGRAKVSAGAALIEAFHRSAMGDSARALALTLGAEIDRLRAAQDSQEGEISIGANVSDVALLTARVMLDSTRALARPLRIEQAFDALQRYKGRLYAQRGARIARSADLRRIGLHDREVFVDLYWAPRDSALATMVIGRGGQAYGAIERGHDPRAEFRLFELYSSGTPHDEGARRTAARALLSRLLGPSFPAVVAARRVYFAPPSWLAQLPLAAMLEDVRPDPAREVVLVPSATWLVHARTNPARVPAAPKVVRVGRSSDDENRSLPGLREESQWLEQRYGARGLLHAGDQPLDAALPWLSRGDVLHVAAHSRIPDFDPWESALLLGRGNDEEAWLTMREIAALPACAPLVVLATCNASIGSNLGHESVYGIASGFLSAGSRAVVSTLWDADDRVTARFTRLFYGELEKGETAGQSLRHAQRTLAADPATRSPHFWAGFVLVGDPGLRMKVTRR